MLRENGRGGFLESSCATNNKEYGHLQGLPSDLPAYGSGIVEFADCSSRWTTMRGQCMFLDGVSRQAKSTKC